MRHISVLAIGVAFLICACNAADDGTGGAGPDGDATDEQPFDSETATSSTSAPAGDDEPMEASMAWTRVPPDEAIFGGEAEQNMSSVTAGGPGFVAVGSDIMSNRRVAAVWTSTDGMTWSRVAHAAVLEGRTLETSLGPVQFDAAMMGIAAGGPGLVAVGVETSALDRNAVVWTSIDGMTWERIPHDEAIFGGEDWAWMNTVEAAGPGVVAAGGASFEENNAAVWTSVDGMSWSRVAHDDSVFGGAGIQDIRRITAAGPGLVAVGLDKPGSFEADAAVWTSADGLSWSRLPDDGGVLGGEQDQEMRDVTAGGPGLVAVGLDWGVDLPTDAAVWSSADGITWVRVPHDEAAFGGVSVQEMYGVSPGGPGLVAVGVSIVEDLEQREAAVWTSPDGVTWSRIPHDEAAFGGEGRREMRGVASDGSVVVAVGSDGELEDLGAAVWVGQ